MLIKEIPWLLIVAFVLMFSGLSFWEGFFGSAACMLVLAIGLGPIAGEEL